MFVTKPLCPICQRTLTMKHEIKHADFHCYPPAVDHHYAARYVRDELVEIKVRYRDADGRKFFCKLDYVTGSTEIWCAASGQVIDREERIKIPQLLETDITDQTKMLQKLKTYLTFS